MSISSAGSAAALMVQGTTSDAGKSLLVAALGRALSRRGVRVAPFKPQNMALNSAVTAAGGEIGRAQALQALACRCEPHTDMNPVLVKPASDTLAQIVIHGQVARDMEAADYHRYKTVAMTAVLESWQRLTARFEAVVVEGAGSPAEINLRDRDIANMGFAEAADVPVIIIADIDRGGVFAHLVGTLDLLSASEQARVVGFVINKFRGDFELLRPGIEWLEERTAKPVLGVLPFLTDLQLDAEDAIDDWQAEPTPDALKIAVPVLPRISNHTDFDVLRGHPQVELTFVGPGQPIPAADLVIIPGSKNVRDDLHSLRGFGWDQQLLRHLRYGGKVLGICGGYQMLGNSIEDPDGVEGTAGSSEGLGLLPLVTRLESGKQLRQVSGVLPWAEAEAAVDGYEIHCGVTEVQGAPMPFALLQGQHEDGYCSSDHQIKGSYLHGVFDSPTACAALLGWAGLARPQSFDRAAQREAELDRLCDAVEQALDLPQLFPQWFGAC